MLFAVPRLIVFHWDYYSPKSQLKLPKEIRGSEIRKRRGSAAAAEGKSGFMVRGNYRRE